MRRLTYSPKALVFIRSSTQGGKVYDVSSDVVSGSVTRNMNDVSTAEIVLRNRFRKWLKDPVNHQSIFLPMDMITIWLQRVAGKPIQVFTGYLDQVPLMQLYPGNCTITASCTLKKLAYQWFDPGLQFFTNWVNSLSAGWQYFPYTGEAFNPGLFAPQGTKQTTSDGGFAQLVYEFMTHIAGWKEDSVLVSDLPSNLPKRAAKLYTDINRSTETDLQQLENALRMIMGMSWTPVNGVNPDGSLTSQKENQIRVIKRAADKMNVPVIVPATAAILATNISVSYTKTDPTFKGNPEFPAGWGIGPYAARPAHSGYDPHHRAPGEVSVNFNPNTKYQGYKLQRLHNLSTATLAFCKDLKDADISSQHSRKPGPYFQKTIQGDSTGIYNWIKAAMKRPLDANEFATALQQADLYIKSWNTSTNNSRISDPKLNALQTASVSTWKSSQVQGVMDSGEQKIYQQKYAGKVIDALAPIYYYLKKNYSTNGAYVHLSYSANQGSNQLVIRTNRSRPVQQDLQSKNPAPDSIKDDLHQGARAPSDFGILTIESHTGATYKWDGIQSHTIKINNPSTKTPDPTFNSGNGLTFGQLGQFSLDAAFSAQFAVPADAFESHLLTGDKALMNDMSCLDAVKQFCQASLRTFMSLPDGRFCAFYPDYFGAHGRGPYWWIHDIEITNMGVQLNDQALATHVYVVGDTFALDGQIDVFDEISSRGVATLTQAFMLDSFVVPENHPVSHDADHGLGAVGDAYGFLQHYGARPYREDQPLIRNTFYEFLYAWQRFMQLWASTFLTTVEFTFQPEIFAGGVIGFAGHNLQMYVQSVTHEFDYTNGFSTSCELSSPAVVNNNGKGIGSIPGFSLGGNINSIGSA